MSMLNWRRAHKTIPGFMIDSWGGTKREREVSLAFDEGDTRLTVTIEEAEVDYVDKGELLEFLCKNSVISDPKQWSVEQEGDTSGDTRFDECWYTVVFRRG